MLAAQVMNHHVMGGRPITARLARPRVATPAANNLSSVMAGGHPGHIGPGQPERPIAGGYPHGYASPAYGQPSALTASGYPTVPGNPSVPVAAVPLTAFQQPTAAAAMPSPFPFDANAPIAPGNEVPDAPRLDQGSNR